MNNLRPYKSLGVDARNNCDHYASHLRYPSVILASKLFLIIFIGFCGSVELFLIHSNVTHLVGLSKYTLKAGSIHLMLFSLSIHLSYD